jgi:hypothetical protein
MVLGKGNGQVTTETMRVQRIVLVVAPLLGDRIKSINALVSRQPDHTGLILEDVLHKVAGWAIGIVRIVPIARKSGCNGIIAGETPAV